MLTRVFSAAIQGVDALQVEVEVNAGSGGDPKIVIVEPIFTFAANSPGFNIGSVSKRDRLVKH